MKKVAAVVGIILLILGGVSACKEVPVIPPNAGNSGE